VTAIDFLKLLNSKKCVPVKRGGSNAELWQMLEQGAVVINGDRPKPRDTITLPIEEMYFYPSGNRVTLW